MTSETPRKKDICSVIVTYHPDAGLPNRVMRFRDQVGGLVVVDNNSGNAERGALTELSSELGVHLILNNENLGIGAALNQGVRWAAEQGYTWVLTLDQDTVVANDMISTLAFVYEQFPEKLKLAIIGSNYIDPNSRRSFLPPSHANRFFWRQVKTVITSGSLVSVAAYFTIGPFREEFFIDCIDLEYCLRARSLGFKVLLASKPLMQHSIGRTTMHRLPWKVTGTSNHVAVRRYYMARNRIVLMREYISREPLWVLRTAYSHLKSTILFCLFEESKWQKLRLTVLGMFDGLSSNYYRRIG
jgi:rhamnosyltransferase